MKLAMAEKVAVFARCL